MYVEKEVNFLLSNYEKMQFFIYQKVTVYHKRKKMVVANKQIIAKGAVYGKNLIYLFAY